MRRWIVGLAEVELHTQTTCDDARSPVPETYRGPSLSSPAIRCAALGFPNREETTRVPRKRKRAAIKKSGAQQKTKHRPLRTPRRRRFDRQIGFRVTDAELSYVESLCRPGELLSECMRRLILEHAPVAGANAVEIILPEGEVPDADDATVRPVRDES